MMPLSLSLSPTVGWQRKRRPVCGGMRSLPLLLLVLFIAVLGTTTIGLFEESLLITKNNWLSSFAARSKEEGRQEAVRDGATIQQQRALPKNESLIQISGDRKEEEEVLPQEQERGCHIVNMSIAISCLKLSKHTTNGTVNLTTLTYPSDAEAHTMEIHRALENWTRTAQMHYAAGYGGPWIENYWMRHFKDSVISLPRQHNASNSSSSVCLSDTFGPFIPLLIPWVDIWLSQGGIHGNRNQYPPVFTDTVKALLRPDVAYITVSQNDQGWALNYYHHLTNVLVLSAGGYGHVPIPLLKQEEKLLDKKKIPVVNRTLLLPTLAVLSMLRMVCESKWIQL